jgi:hypothetical protein
MNNQLNRPERQTRDSGDGNIIVVPMKKKAHLPNAVFDGISGVLVHPV